MSQQGKKLGAKAKTGYENFKRKWLSDPSTYPIIIIITAASALAVGYTARLGLHPSAKWNPTNRKEPIADDHEYGQQYYDHAVRKFVKGEGEPRIFGKWNKWGASKNRDDDD